MLLLLCQILEYLSYSLSGRHPFHHQPTEIFESIPASQHQYVSSHFILFALAAYQEVLDTSTIPLSDYTITISKYGKT